MEMYCTKCKKVFYEDYLICPYCGTPLNQRVGRQTIPHALRHEVFKRDGYRCRECGATNKETTLEIDHIIPVSLGGTNDISNLQTLCKECNRAKYTNIWTGGIKYDELDQLRNIEETYDAYNNDLQNLNNIYEELKYEFQNNWVTTDSKDDHYTLRTNKVRSEHYEIKLEKLNEINYRLENNLKFNKSIIKLIDNNFSHFEEEILVLKEDPEFSEEKLIDLKYILNKTEEIKKELEIKRNYIMDKLEEIKTEIQKVEEKFKDTELLYKKLYIEEEYFLNYLFKKYIPPHSNFTKEEKISYLLINHSYSIEDELKLKKEYDKLLFEDDNEFLEFLFQRYVPPFSSLETKEEKIEYLFINYFDEINNERKKRKWIL